MPKLLDLANETLLQIISHTQVEDIESFSSCNKHMRWLFGSVLQLHMERKKKYSKIKFGRAYSHERSPHAVTLLRDVLENPAIARYPTEVIMGHCIPRLRDWPGLSNEGSVEGRMEITEAIDQCRERLGVELSGYPYIRECEKQDWVFEITAGKEGTAVALLILMFYNLRSLTIVFDNLARWVENSNRLFGLVSTIAVAHRKAPGSVNSLQKLATVRELRYSSSGAFSGVLLEPFRDLQSVRNLAIEMVPPERMVWGDYQWDIDDHEEEDDSPHEDDVENLGGVESENEGENKSESSDEHSSTDAGKMVLDDVKGEDGKKDAGEDKEENEKTLKDVAADYASNITQLTYQDCAIDAEPR